MNVRVLFFSVLRDVTGVAETRVQLVAAGASVAFLLEELFQKWPGLRPWDRSLLVAVDHVYVRRDQQLHDDAEVAIMPPVQGG